MKVQEKEENEGPFFLSQMALDSSYSGPHQKSQEQTVFLFDTYFGYRLQTTWAIASPFEELPVHISEASSRKSRLNISLISHSTTTRRNLKRKQRGKTVISQRIFKKGVFRKIFFGTRINDTGKEECFSGYLISAESLSQFSPSYPLLIHPITPSLLLNHCWKSGQWLWLFS